MPALEIRVLAPSSDVARSLAPGGRGDGGHVRPRLGLGHREGGHDLSLGDRPEPAVLLRLRSAQQDRRGARAPAARTPRRRAVTPRRAPPASGSSRGDRDRESAGASPPHRAGRAGPAPPAARRRRRRARAAGRSLPWQRRRPARRATCDAVRERCGSVACRACATRTSVRAWRGRLRTPRGSWDAACSRPGPGPPTRSRRPGPSRPPR